MDITTENKPPHTLLGKKQPLVSREILFPFIMITSLFALWGIANDMTNPMVNAFKKVMPELSNTQSYLVQFAFYVGYFTMALPAALFIRKFSYKSGVVLGLILYAIGTFMFLPAAKYENFNFYLVSLWVITCGLAFLETTSNPLVLALGPKENAARRLNLSQAFNPIGSLTGMVVAQLVVIGQLKSSDYTEESYAALDEGAKAAIRSNDLGVISAPYIGLGLVVVVILIIIAFTKMPKTADEKEIDLNATFKKLFANSLYMRGVLAQAFYVGAQIMCWTTIFQYVDHLNSQRPEDQQLVATAYNVAAMVSFLAGRWIGTALMGNFKPARILMLFGLCGTLACAGAIFLPGMAGLYALVAISIFMSVMFPTIYGIALDGMGDEAKIGSAGLVMAIVGGALLPLLQGSILDIGGKGLADHLLFGYIPEVNYSFVLPMFCLFVVFTYGRYALKNTMNK